MADEVSNNTSFSFAHVSSRNANERKFKQWKELEGGGRLYSREVKGKQGWKARYFKEVDGEEETVRFWQEIYNERNELTELHEKFPVDTGHQKLKP